MPPVRERLGVFPPEDRAQVTVTACGLPCESAVALSRWSRRELARAVQRKLNGLRVSASTIGRWLAQEKVQPWRYRRWQHINDPEVFLERARPILRLYGQAQTLLRQGTWVVCLDEKTSIQAREGEAAPRGAQAASPLLVSPRYHRRGACQLFAGLSVADGKVYGACRARKRFVDFQAFLEEVIVAEALRRGVEKLVLILDNGPTHAPKRFERWLGPRLAARGLAVEVYWLPVRASWLDQLENWFSILQRKVLVPNHFGSCQELEQAIARFIAHYNETARPIAWTYTVEKLEAKLGMH